MTSARLLEGEGTEPPSEITTGSLSPPGSESGKRWEPVRTAYAPLSVDGLSEPVTQLRAPVVHSWAQRHTFYSFAA